MAVQAKLALLIEEARAGSHQAFAELVGRSTPHLESFVTQEMGAFLSSKVEVSDLLQQIYMKAFLTIRRFDGRNEPSFLCWLCAIAKHVVVDEGRRLRRKKRSGGQEASQLVDLLEARAITPSEVLRREERFQRLEKAIKSLSPDHHRVIVLMRIQGLSTKEAAQRIGRSEKATSVLLLRAMRKLKAAFGHTDSFHLPQRTIEQL